MVELDDFLHRKPAELSGGQRQRVALARAIVREPNVFLMDEPLSNLDAKLRVSTRAQIKNLSHELSVTTIYVTHDQIEAMTLADRVVVMKNGLVQQVGTPDRHLRQPRQHLRRGFHRQPGDEPLGGVDAGGRLHRRKSEIAGLSAPTAPVTLGFRAEDAAVHSEAEGRSTRRSTRSSLLGDATMVTLRIGKTLVSVRADKILGPRSTTGFRSVPAGRCHLFRWRDREETSGVTRGRSPGRSPGAISGA